MAKSTQLDLVLDLAKNLEDEAGQQLRDAQAQLEREKIQLVELQSYYQGYEQAFSQRIRGIKAASLMRDRAFLNQLSQLQKQQIQAIERASQLVNHKRNAWLEAHSKAQSLQELIDRQRRQADRELDKREQKLLDDWVQQISFRRD